MNSRPENNPKDLMQHQLVKMEEGLMQAGAYINQLQRILWLVIQASGGKVTINEGAIDPLWRLDKIRLESGELCLTSSTQAPPSEEEIGRLIDKLRGTQIRIEDVQKELGLDAWPPQYLAFQISHKLAIANGLWTDAEIARQMSKGSGNN